MCMHICEDQDGKSDSQRDTERHTSKAYKVTQVWESDRNILPSFMLDLHFASQYKTESTCLYLGLAPDASYCELRNQSLTVILCRCHYHGDY